MQVTLFGRELKRLRAEHGLTVRDFATRLGKSVAYVAKIEVQGEIPTGDVITDIAVVLGEPPERLIALAKEVMRSRAEREIESRYSQFLRVPQKTAPAAASVPKSEGGQMATTVSLINMKGGVGKTTLAMHLAHAADKSNLRVLAVDLDPQSNLSQALLGPKKYVDHLDADKPTVVQIFDEYVPTGTGKKSPKRLDVEKVILRKAGYWSDTTLDLIPSRLELSNTLKNPYGRERLLAKALAQVADQYDLILIDCAPTESVLTDAAYFASRYVVVPIKPEFMATIGLPLLARSLNQFQLANDDHEIGIAGLVFNHSSSYSSGPEGQRSIKDVTDVASNEGWYVCENQMRYSASYAKSAREAAPLANTSYSRADVVSGFKKLKDEIFGRIGLP